MSTSSALSSVLFVGLLSITACSGSSTSGSSGSPSSSSESGLGGSAKAKTCKNVTLNPPRTAIDDACDACDAKECSAEGAAVLGTDPDAFGGACAAFITCSCECEKADSACLLACPSATQACTDAIAAAQSCEKSKCAAACAKDGG